MSLSPAKRRRLLMKLAAPSIVKLFRRNPKAVLDSGKFSPEEIIRIRKRANAHEAGRQAAKFRAQHASIGWKNPIEKLRAERRFLDEVNRGRGWRGRSAAPLPGKHRAADSLGDATQRVFGLHVGL